MRVHVVCVRGDALATSRTDAVASVQPVPSLLVSQGSPPPENGRIGVVAEQLAVLLIETVAEELALLLGKCGHLSLRWSAPLSGAPPDSSPLLDLENKNKFY